MKIKTTLLILLCALIVIPAVLNSAAVVAETGADPSPSARDPLAGQDSPSVRLPGYKSAQERLESMELVSESKGTKLYFDPVTCDIAVVNKNGALFSTPYDVSSDSRASEAYKTYMASQIRLEYLDRKMTEGELLSFKDCVSLGQFTTEKLEGGIKINMVLGREEQRLLLPVALPAESFEGIILAQLEGRAVTRLKAFYKKYDPAETSPAQIEAIKEKYPMVEEMAIYVLKSVTEREKKEIEGYISSTTYSFEQLEEDIKKTGAREEEIDMPCFKLSVSYQLDQGDLVVKLPADSIEYDRDKFTLTHIGILEYFGSSHIEQDGYVFIPDGSGAIIKFNHDMQKDGGFISLPVYGYDRSLSYAAANDSKAIVRLPVFGIKSGDQAFLAILEQGAALATINATAGGSFSSYAAANAVFAYCESDRFIYKDIGKQYAWTLADSNEYTGDYQIRYKLLGEGEADYSGMAAAYRTYLISAGKLPSAMAKASALPFYIGMYGTVMNQERILGFPVSKKIPLTTFEDAYVICNELAEEGIKNQNVRYLAWANGGMDHTAFNRAGVERVLGGKSKLKELNTLLEAMDIGLFMDADLAYVAVDKWFDGFSPYAHTGRMLNKTYAGFRKPDLASGLMDNDTFRYALRPYVMKSFFEKYIRQYKELGLAGISLGSIGSDLNSDKDEKRGANRDTARSFTEEILMEAARDHEVMTEGGNSYTFPYASHIIALEAGSSGYPDSDHSVPFMQMVLHGSICYSTVPVNLSGDPETELLKAVENGAGLYFEVTYRNSSRLKTTKHRDLYSTDYATWRDTMVEYYKRANAVLGDLTDQTIVKHEYIAEGVPMITYSSGARIVVNYTDEDITVDGHTVKARDFFRLDR